MNDSERLHFLAGEVSALRAFALAVIASHRDLSLLRTEFERLSESQIALSTAATVHDSYLDGQRQTIDDLRSRIKAGLLP